jgi:hypothetical protein
MSDSPPGAAWCYFRGFFVRDVYADFLLSHLTDFVISVDGFKLYNSDV